MSSEIERYLYYPEMTPRRIYNLGLLKVLALILLGLSLIGLGYVVRLSPAPVYKTRDLVGNFLLNYAVVMVEGVVAEPVRLDEQIGGRIRLTIRIVDEEGVEPFTVFAYDPVASQLIKGDRYIDIGDRVRLLIQLRVREDFTHGILQDVNHVYIQEKTTLRNPVTVTSLRGIEQYRYVCIEGQLNSVRNVTTGLLLRLTTLNDSVTVLVPWTFIHRHRAHVEFSDKWSSLNKIGEYLGICGPVYYYRGEIPEVVLLEIKDVAARPIPEVVEVDIPQLGGYIGEVVSVKGYFSKISYDPSTRLYLIHIVDEEGNSLVATAPRSLVNVSIDPWTTGTGSLVRIIGRVVSPDTVNTSLIEVLEKRPVFNATTVLDSISQPHGVVVVLWNVRVINSRVTSGGSWIIDVSDNRDSIRIFIPSSVARGIAPNPPGVDSIIAVAGYRDIYGEYEEIVVYTESGLRILSRQVAETPVTPTPDTGLVRLRDLGRYIGLNVSAKGALIAIRYSAGLYYVEVEEEGVRVNISMTRGIASKIDPWKAGPGTLLVVKGTVESSNLLRAHDLTISEANRTPVLTVRDALNTPLGSLVAIVNATVVDFRETRGGDWQITITDESGVTILVFIPRSVVGELNVPKPTTGSRISVAGYRDVYRGIQEIIVYSSLGYKRVD